jgi:hypothetical protein
MKWEICVQSQSPLEITLHYQQADTMVHHMQVSSGTILDRKKMGIIVMVLKGKVICMSNT